MELKDYQPLARRTMKEMPLLKDHLNHMSVGVVGEMGEFADWVKKAFVYGKPVDPTNKKGPRVFGMEALALVREDDPSDPNIIRLEEEMGDGWWYTVGFVPELKLSIIDVAAAYAYGTDLIVTQGWAGTAIDLVMEANAQIAVAANDLNDPDLIHDDSGRRTMAVQVIARNYGRLSAYFGIDLARTLNRNIAKLSKRYGEAYSDVAAQVRDLQAEFAILSAPVQRVVAERDPLAGPDTIAVQGGEQLVAEPAAAKTTKKA